MASICIIKKFKNGVEAGYVSQSNDENAIYTDSRTGPHEFLKKEDAITVAEFKNWYAALHSLDVYYRVFETVTEVKEVPLPTKDFLSDRPTVEIEEPGRNHGAEIEE